MDDAEAYEAEHSDWSRRTRLTRRVLDPSTAPRSGVTDTPRAGLGLPVPPPPSVYAASEESARWDHKARITNLDHMAREVVIVFDPAGDYRFIDPEARWVLGYTRDQLADIPMQELIHEEDVGHALDVFESVSHRHGEQARTEVRIRHASGEWRWFEIMFKNVEHDPRFGGIAAHLHDVTDRRVAEENVRARDQRFRALVQHSFDALMVSDAHNVITFATPSIEPILGYTVDEVIGSNGYDYLHPDDMKAAQGYGLAALRNPGGKVLGEYRLRHRDGSYRWVEAQIGNLSDDPHVAGFVQCVRDVTDRKEAEERIRASQRRLRSLVENADAAIIVMDDIGRVTWLSPGAEALWGLAPGCLSKWGLMRRTHQEHRQEMARTFAKLTHAAAGTTARVECRMRHEDGSWRWYEAVEGMVVNVRDITERVLADQALRESEARLEFQANHDPLTGLPNRTMLFDRMHAALAESKAGDRSVAVLFCDLDNFKYINDCHGHALGDELLRAVAERLDASLDAGQLVSRFGGDEFVILAPDLGGVEAAALAQRVTDNLREPFATSRGDLYITASIGISLESRDHASSEDLIRDADAAMYDAKERGRARVEIFDATMRARAVERLDVERGLRRALGHGELRAHYQPIIDLTDGRVAGFEALVRWQHPERGLLAPGAFIAVAEQTGLVMPLGAWVLEESCRTMARWQEERPADDQPPCWIAVNLSTRQLADDHLTTFIADVLDRSGLAPSSLHLEIVESALMEDIEHSQDVLRGLKALGVRLAIDDFGTGYSSFSYLSTLPVDILKIDQSFIHKLAHPAGGSDHAALVEAMINLAHILHMEVVAEGVEHAEQATLLAERGCDLAQGYHYAKPMSEDAVAALPTHFS